MHCENTEKTMKPEGAQQIVSQNHKTGGTQNDNK